MEGRGCHSSQRQWGSEVVLSGSICDRVQGEESEGEANVTVQ